MSQSWWYGCSTWLVLMVTRWWSVILVGLVVISVVSGGFLITDSTDQSHSIEEVGELHLSIEPIETTNLDPAVEVPADQVIPITLADQMSATARYDVSPGADPHDIDTLVLKTKSTRSIADGIAWERATTIDVGAGDPPLTVESKLRLDTLLDTATKVDEQLGISRGQLTISVKATVISQGTIRQQTVATIVPHAEYVELNPEVSEPITVVIEDEKSTDRWPFISFALGLGGLMIIGGLRITGRVPIKTGERDSYRVHAAMWRTRQPIINQSSSIGVTDAVLVADPTEVIQAAERADRPIRVDRFGTVAVTIDECTYVWWPDAAVQDT